MQAITLSRYGGPEVLELTEFPDPKLGGDSVLVRVRAAGVNPVDWAVREGFLTEIYDTRLPMVLGWDAAGEVVAVGPAVTEFAPGDEVIGLIQQDQLYRGAYAELVAVRPETLARKPAKLSWDEAAGLPLAGLTAYQALTRGLSLAKGDVLVIHAAAGGVGSMAVQIGRALGARVIGTASEPHHDYLRSLGAEPVSYGAGLLERVRALVPAGADAVLDLVGGETLDISPGLASATGRLASVVDPRVTQLGGRFIVVRHSSTDLLRLVEYVERDELSVHVSDTFPLAQAAQAHRQGQSGHTRGKLILRIE